MSLIMDVLVNTEQKIQKNQKPLILFPEETARPAPDSQKSSSRRSLFPGMMKLMTSMLLPLTLLALSFWMGLSYKFWFKNTIFSSQETKAVSNPASAGMSSDKNIPVYQGKKILEGIVLDGRKPYCLIGGQIFNVGDYWAGKKITSIKREGVYLKSVDGNVMVLKAPGKL